MCWGAAGFLLQSTGLEVARLCVVVILEDLKGLASSELSKSVLQLLLCHLTAPELTLKPPLSSQDSMASLKVEVYSLPRSPGL